MAGQTRETTGKSTMTSSQYSRGKTSSSASTTHPPSISNTELRRLASVVRRQLCELLICLGSLGRQHPEVLVRLSEIALPELPSDSRIPFLSRMFQDIPVALREIDDSHLQQLLRSPPREAVTVRLLLALREVAMLLTKPTNTHLLTLTSDATPLASSQAELRSRVEFLLRLQHTFRQLSAERLVAMSRQLGNFPSNVHRQQLLAMEPNIDQVLLPCFCQLLQLSTTELTSLRAWMISLEPTATPALAHLLTFESAALLDLKAKINISGEGLSGTSNPSQAASSHPSGASASSASTFASSSEASYSLPVSAPVTATRPSETDAPAALFTASMESQWGTDLMRTGSQHEPSAPVTLPFSDQLSSSPLAMPGFDILRQSDAGGLGLAMHQSPISLSESRVDGPSAMFSGGDDGRQDDELALLDEMLGSGAGDATLEDDLLGDLLGDSSLSFTHDPLSFLEQEQAQVFSGATPDFAALSSQQQQARFCSASRSPASSDSDALMSSLKVPAVSKLPSAVPTDIPFAIPGVPGTFALDSRGSIASSSIIPSPASTLSSSSSSSSSSSASSDSSSGGGDTSAVSPPVASASDDDSSEVARLRRENEELRQKYTSLQSQYAALEQRYTSLQKNLINAKLSPRVRSESFEAEKEKGVARFTDEQREIAKAAFEEYDRDGNGSIDQSELILLMEELRRSKVLNMSDSLFKRYVRMNWKAIDTDESGEISFDEFMEFLFSSSMLNRDLATKVRQSSSDLIKRRSQTGMSPLKMERSTEPKETAADASQ